MSRHWSFAVVDRFRLYLLAGIILSTGVIGSVAWQDPGQIQRVGNFVLLLAVWATLRGVLREGTSKDLTEEWDHPKPRFGTQQWVDDTHRRLWRRGDAALQIHAFWLALLGSIMSSYGDVILKAAAPGLFR